MELPGDVLLHEQASGGGQMRLEVCEGVADERPTATGRWEVQPLQPLPSDEVDVEEEGYQSRKKEEGELVYYEPGHWRQG